LSEILDAGGLDIIFRRARSYNRYSPEALTQDQLRAIWDLAKLGPTSANQSPARVVWCTTPTAKAKLAAHVAPNNTEKILKAPATAIVGMDMAFYDKLPKLFPHVDARAWFEGKEELCRASALRNSSLQGGYLIIAARALGFDTGPVSGFDNAAVDTAFFAGTSIRSNFLCTLGHGDSASIYERLPRLDFEEANTVV
jgi:3-hydroxypropanoate dehydrogenase